MKLNHINRILDFSVFTNLTDAEYFFKNQNCSQKLFLKDTFGDNHCVIKCMDSLSRELEFCLGFSSETEIGELNLITKFNSDRWIVQIDDELKNTIINKSKIHSPLIGLYFIDNKLIALEEAGLKVLDLNGKLLQIETTDLIDTFQLQSNSLIISTIEGEQVEIELVV